MILSDWIVWGSILAIALLSFSRASLLVLIEASIAYSLVNYLESQVIWENLGVDYMLIMAFKDALFLLIFLKVIKKYALIKIAYALNIVGNLSSYVSFWLYDNGYAGESLFNLCYDSFEAMQLTINALFILGLIINDSHRIFRRVCNYLDCHISDNTEHSRYYRIDTQNLGRAKRP